MVHQPVLRLAVRIEQPLRRHVGGECGRCRCEHAARQQCDAERIIAPCHEVLPNVICSEVLWSAKVYITKRPPPTLPSRSGAAADSRPDFANSLPPAEKFAAPAGPIPCRRGAGNVPQPFEAAAPFAPESPRSCAIRKNFPCQIRCRREMGPARGRPAPQLSFWSRAVRAFG